MATKKKVPFRSLYYLVDAFTPDVIVVLYSGSEDDCRSEMSRLQVLHQNFRSKSPDPIGDINLHVVPAQGDLFKTFSALDFTIPLHSVND